MSLAQPLPCLEAVYLQMLLFCRNGRADLRLGMVAQSRRGVMRLQSPTSHGRSVRETRRDPALSSEWKFRGASVRLGHLLVRRRTRRPHYGEHVCRPRSAVDVFALLWVSYRKFCRHPPCYEIPSADNESFYGDQYLRKCESAAFAQKMILKKLINRGAINAFPNQIRCNYDGTYGAIVVGNPL